MPVAQAPSAIPVLRGVIKEGSVCTEGVERRRFEVGEMMNHSSRTRGRPNVALFCGNTAGAAPL